MNHNKTITLNDLFQYCQDQFISYDINMDPDIFDQKSCVITLHIWSKYGIYCELIIRIYDNTYYLISVNIDVVKWNVSAHIASSNSSYMLLECISHICSLEVIQYFYYSDLLNNLWRKKENFDDYITLIHAIKEYGII